MPYGAIVQEYFQDLACELIDLRALEKSGKLGDAEERLASLEELFEEKEAHALDWETPTLTGDPEIDRLERAFARGELDDVDPWADENQAADATKHH